MIPHNAPTGAGSFLAGVSEKIDQVREKARAEGFTAGLEAAAEWHDVQLGFNASHSESAKAIRALGKEGS